MTKPNREDAIDPVIFGSRCLEQRRDAEIVRRGIDHFALLDPLDDIGWTVAYPPIGHADQGIVACLEDQPDV